jgi:tRNA (guanine37-N1)-methyltransferase
LVSGLGVVTIEAGGKGLPLAEHAPKEDDPIWSGLTHVTMPREVNKIKHWSDLLDRELYQQFEQYWPQSYEMVGDVLIVRLEDEIKQYQNEIARAMLDRISSARIICADNGVTGEFRVRDISPILARDNNFSTLTKVRENGHNIIIDPAKAYFSSRLSTEREGNVVAAKQLVNLLNRPIAISDPYAGVGPALPSLIATEGLVEAIFAGDLNPDAVELLTDNIESLVNKSNYVFDNQVMCMDAREWRSVKNLTDSTDLLLVNLPHDTIEHLSDLIPLMRKGTMSLIRGWAIVERQNLDGIRKLIKKKLIQHGAKEISLTCKEIKGFSASKIFIRIESWQIFP